MIYLLGKLAQKNEMQYIMFMVSTQIE